MSKTEKRQKSPFQTIVVGVDFSKYSKIVLKQAESLAQQLKAKLVVVYANTMEWQMAGPEFFYPAYPPDNQEIRKSLEKFYHLKSSDQVEIQIKNSPVDESVIGTAKKNPDPLIIVGSQGKSAVSRYILGSNAESIALKSPYPVWVHRGRKIVPFKKVLVPTDLSSNSQKQISTFQTWSQKYPLSLNFLFVRPEVLPILQYPAYKEMSERLHENIEVSMNKFKRRGLKAPLVTLTGNNPSQEISKIGKKYDVIAMNPHNHPGFMKEFGRVTSKVIRLADNPVLVMKG